MLKSLLLPIVMPSWKFFDRIGPRIKIELPFEILLPGPRSIKEIFLSLFLNSNLNERLFLYSLAEQIYVLTVNTQDEKSSASRARLEDLFCSRIQKLFAAKLVTGEWSGPLPRVRVQVDGELVFESDLNL